MRGPRLYPTLFLPLLLVVLALIIFLVVPALTSGGKASHNLPPASAAAHR